ncbi:ABC transporter ATP-binding protein [Streptomyces globisporus]|uniref:ABC transporter ATP-binding protein n=1 Tax=Streptomyces globisporus TaxID=1908 RepID=UPI0036FFFC0D
MDGELIVRARSLCKSYGQVDAVRNVDFRMFAGEVVGLLGHNGAGKSTTVRMFAGMSRRDSGYLHVLGSDPDVAGPSIRARTGYLAQRSVLDAELTVRDNLEVHGGYFGLRRTAARKRADELLEFAGLSDRARARVGSLSGGMARKLAISRALVNDPDLLLLDEPASGLDPQARQAVWTLLGQLRRRGVAQLLTTHHMEEAHALCDRIVVLADGRVIAEGTPQELIDRHAGRSMLELRCRTGGGVRAADRLIGHFPGLHTVGDHLLIPTDDTDAALATVRRAAVDFEAVVVRSARLEDAYLALTVKESAR